ncbi:hydantoinase/oxoprolinase family protein [Aliiroseovarius sp. 2305UL8-7]|uniref:hydantoinase/oxoprolinase family protein n=1 Tax=Aliiroseovarius conchicola TaxID=3121637 RepID=UPI0035277BD3
MIRLATDVGGTFTDLLGYDEKSGRIYSAKSLTTTDDQSRGVLDTIALAQNDDGLQTDRVGFFVHGGTTVINAITERKGVKTALVTTRGFRDVLEIARGNRPDLYNLQFHSPKPYVERALRFEVSERINARGEVEEAISHEDIAAIAEKLRTEQVEAVAILFLNSYANPEHEAECGRALGEVLDGVTICCSHEVSGLWREYERSNTVALNAYVKPIIARYFAKLETKLIDVAVKCAHYAMLSNGGVASFAQAAESPLNLVESGPSGGIAGAARVGEILNEPNILAFDVGGTTAKCSVIVDGKPRVFSDYRMEWSRTSPGYPVQVPVVDIVEIGAGGGSIARVDAFGALTVGPDSAGSDPGPVCYGRGGTEPTVTDAKLLTGVIDPDNFATGQFDLDLESARAAMGRLGEKLGMDADQAALAVVELAEANMINALKLVTIQRGHDPRDFTLVVTGGGGPLFAASLGRELNAKRVVIPPHAGIFSAWGMLAARPRADMRKTWFRELNDAVISPLQTEIEGLRRDAVEYFGVARAEDLNCSVSLQMRYRGQEHSVSTHVDDVTDAHAIAKTFHAAHKTAYSFELPETAVEITGVHVTAEMESPVISFQTIASEELTKEKAKRGGREVLQNKTLGWTPCTTYDREALPSDEILKGPVLVEEPTTTTLVLSGQQVSRDAHGLLIIKETRAN